MAGDTAGMVAMVSTVGMGAMVDMAMAGMAVIEDMVTATACTLGMAATVDMAVMEDMATASMVGTAATEGMATASTADMAVAITAKISLAAWVIEDGRQLKAWSDPFLSAARSCNRNTPGEFMT